MSRVFIGIDVGKSGAIAVLSPEPSLFPVPIISGTRPEYDLVTIKDFFKGWQKEYSWDLFVTLEKSQPMPKSMGGGIANFARGESRGWAWLLTGLGISYQMVSPQSWQKALLRDVPGSDTKQRSIIKAQQLFPDVDLRRTPRSKKPDHNFADALLLAYFSKVSQY